MNGRTFGALHWSFVAITVTFVAMEIFQGLARYLVGDSPLVIALYLPKMAMAAMLVAHVAVSSTVTRAALPFLSVIGISLVIGFLSNRNLLQTAFGLWVLLPAIFGFSVGRHVYAAIGTSLVWPIRLLWGAALAGVILNFFYEVPWTGTELDVLGQTVEGSRDWTTQGISRLAGFSRASFAVASQLLLLSLLMLPYLRWRTIRLLCWVITGIAIVVTTTKATIGAWVFCTLYLLMARSAFRGVAAALPVVVAGSAILFPLLLADGNAYFDFSWLGLDDNTTNLVVNSVLQRFTEGWPDAFQYIAEEKLMLTGTGIGGFGAAAKLFNPDIYNPGDNITVGLYLSFGVWAFVPLTWFLLRISPIPALRGHSSEPFHTPLILAISAVSLTTYVIEDALMSFLLGAAIRELVRSNDRRMRARTGMGDTANVSTLTPTGTA